MAKPEAENDPNVQSDVQSETEVTARRIKAGDKPVTDFKTTSALPPQGLDVEKAGADAVKRREELLDARREEQFGTRPLPPTIFVRPARQGARVARPGGGFYPVEGMRISPNDIFTARRLRDGSLIQSEVTPDKETD